MSSRLTTLIAIVSAALLWSTSGVVAKILLTTVNPIPLAFTRFLLASLVILPFFLYQKKRNRISFKQILTEVVPIALFGVGNIAFFYFGIAKTTANAASIIYTTQPLLSVIFSRYLIKEQITSKKLQGILIGFLGVLIIVLLPLLEKGEPFAGDLWGNILIIIATLCWTFYTIGSRYLISYKKYSPLSITTVSLITSTCIFFILTLIFPQPQYMSTFTKPLNLVLILHLAILVTVAAYLLFQWAIKHSSATTASFNNYLQPVFGFVLNSTFLGEQMTLGFFIGSVLVLTGVFLASGMAVLKELKNVRSLLVKK